MQNLGMLRRTKQTCDAKQRDMQDKENASSHFVLDLLLRFLLFLQSDVNMHNDIIDVMVRTMTPMTQCSNRRTVDSIKVNHPAFPNFLRQRMRVEN